MVRTHPELAGTMDRWVHSDDFWLARTAILHQLLYREATDAHRLFSYAQARAGDDQFFVRKAIGWSLRRLFLDEQRSARLRHRSPHHLSGTGGRCARPVAGG